MSATLIKPEPDSAAVRNQVGDQYRVKSLKSGMASFGIAAAVWLVTFAGILFLPTWMWWAKVLLALINGSAGSALFLAGHDAGHGTLVPKRWMNRLIGRICLLPALHPFTAWVHNHNVLHHAFTNVKEKDPGFPPLSVDEYRAKPWFGRWLYRCSRGGVPGLGLMYFTGMWMKWEMFPNAARTPRNRWQFQIDRLIVIAFAIAWIGSLVGVAFLMEDEPLVPAIVNVLCGFVLPYAVWNIEIGFIIFQQHTHPRVPWYSELDKPKPTFFQAQVKATPHIWFAGPFRFLMRNIMEHTAHHADPRIPHYHLPQAQHQIERQYKKEMVRVIWSRNMLKTTLQTCRLYDYETHRWCDYDGTPLTESLIVRVPVDRQASARGAQDNAPTAVEPLMVTAPG
jgi:omega-6 fatty acid desaturase (delta-12 desaturase)